jgi:hypothetical protein
MRRKKVRKLATMERWEGAGSEEKKVTNNGERSEWAGNDEQEGRSSCGKDEMKCGKEDDNGEKIRRSCRKDEMKGGKEDDNGEKIRRSCGKDEMKCGKEDDNSEKIRRICRKVEPEGGKWRRMTTINRWGGASRGKD